MAVNVFKALSILGTAMEQAGEAAEDGDISLGEIANGGATVAKLTGLPVSEEKLALGIEVLTIIDAAQGKGLSIKTLSAIAVPAITAAIDAAIEAAAKQAEVKTEAKSGDE